MTAASYVFLGGGNDEGEGETRLLAESHALGGVILKFSAKWCGPCRAVHEDFVRMAQQSPVPCFHIDIEDDPLGLAATFGIEKLPTFLLLQNGEEVGRVEGASLDQIAQLFLAPSLVSSAA